MIPFIIREKRIGFKSYFRKRKVILTGTLPSSFDDITARQFYLLRKTTDVYEQVAILTGITAHSWKVVVNQEKVSKWLEWLNIEDLEKIEKPKHVMINGTLYDFKDDIGKDSFAQKIIAQRKLASCKTQEEQIKIIPELVAIYLQPYFSKSGEFDADKAEDTILEVLKMPVSIVIPLGDFIIKDLVRIIDREAKNLKYTPDRKEILAGVSELNKFGEKNLIDTLAGGDVLKHDDILKLPYNSVYLKLYQESVKAKINKRYMDLSLKK